MSKLTPIIEKSFSQYAGAVLQSRALVDVRDCLKPSARQIFYSMLLHKLCVPNVHKKTANAVGMSMADFYIHGDSSCTGIIMRAGQDFAMRYPLIDVKGNMGSLIESGNWAAMRYTESRIGKLAKSLFEDLDKDTITDWRDNYDNTKQYPSVLPSKGFYNIVNGTQGIGVGAASSIPQFNLVEVNEALTKLLWNPDIDFEEIYCAPDFATGGILLNEEEVKQSLKNGTGKSCKLRSVIEYDGKDRVLVIKEIPYGVYTNTICAELDKIIESDNNPGIESYKDLTGATPNIKINLNKRANVDRVLKNLYKNTSLQYYYGINFTMLDNGRFPRVFTWKEALQAHLNHEVEIYRRGFEFDLKKILARRHILEGLFIALAQIEEVIHTIKSSNSTASANKALQEKFILDEIQAKAILDMKLSRLAHLEVEKLEKEDSELSKEEERIEAILKDDNLLKKEIEKGLKEVSQNYGDKRRTKIMSLEEINSDEVLEEKKISCAFTSEGALYVSEASSLYTQKRNGVGNKFKLDKGEYVIDNVVGDNTDTMLFFTTLGNFYHIKMSEFEIGEKQYLNRFINLIPKDRIKTGIILEKNCDKNYIIFITKKGIIKKSPVSEYNLKRNSGATAIKLDNDDEIVSILITDEDRLGILSQNGNFIIIDSNDVRPTSRISRGVAGMKLEEKDIVVAADIIDKNTKEIISITEDGYGKRTPFEEFRLTGRNTKGVKIQKGTALRDFLPICDMCDVLINSNNSQIRVNTNDFSLSSRGALGTKTIKLVNNAKVIKITKI